MSKMIIFLKLIIEITWDGEAQTFGLAVVETDVLHDDVHFFRSLRLVHHPRERRHRFQRSADPINEIVIKDDWKDYHYSIDDSFLLLLLTI